MFQRAGEALEILAARRLREHREVETVGAEIPRAGARIARELVDGEKGAFGVVQENGLGAVEIEHGHSFGAGGYRFQRGNRHIVQVAKAHRSAARGMMPRRTHQTENRLARPRRLQGGQRRADGGAGVIHEIRVAGSILVEVLFAT